MRFSDLRNKLVAKGNVILHFAVFGAFLAAALRGAEIIWGEADVLDQGVVVSPIDDVFRNFCDAVRIATAPNHLTTEPLVLRWVPTGAVFFQSEIFRMFFDITNRVVLVTKRGEPGLNGMVAANGEIKTPLFQVRQ